MDANEAIKCLRVIVEGYHDKSYYYDAVSFAIKALSESQPAPQPTADAIRAELVKRFRESNERFVAAVESRIWDAAVEEAQISSCCAATIRQFDAARAAVSDWK